MPISSKRKLTKVDIAYLAGLFDGEGCIHINRHYAAKRADLRTDSFRLYAQVTMGNKSILLYCQKKTGLGTVQKHGVTNPTYNNPAWCWMMSTRDALRFLKIIKPFLQLKKGEAEIALKVEAISPWLKGGANGNTKKSQRTVNKLARLYWRLRIAKPRWRFYKRKLKPGQVQELKKLGLKF